MSPNETIVERFYCLKSFQNTKWKADNITYVKFLHSVIIPQNFNYIFMSWKHFTACSIKLKTRGSHLHKAYRSRTICDHNQDFWFMKICLDHLIALKKGPWSHDILVWNLRYVLLKLPLSWATRFPLWNIPWSLDLVKNVVLIPWFYCDPSRKWFYRPYESD